MALQSQSSVPLERLSAAASVSMPCWALVWNEAEALLIPVGSILSGCGACYHGSKSRRLHRKRASSKGLG